MTNEEKEEVRRIFREELSKLTQPVEELPTSDNLADFTTMPVLSRDGSMKTLRAELLKGAKGDNGERGAKGETGKTGEPGAKGKDGKDGRIALVNHGTNDTTFALTPNTMHVWGEVERLRLSLAPNTEPNIRAEYDFQFTTPANNPTDFLLSGVQWQGEVVPTILKGKTYQGMVVNGFAALISN